MDVGGGKCKKRRILKVEGENFAPETKKLFKWNGEGERERENNKENR